MTEMMQFQSQFEAVERPTPRDRIEMGKVSPITTQAPGPQVEAKEDVDTDEGDLGLGDHVVVGAGGTDDGGDELADQHAESTPDEEGTTTELLNGVEGDGGRADVDEGGDEGNQEGVRDRSEVLEEGGTEVEDEVDTSPLLHHLNRGTENNTTEVGAGVAETTREASGPRREVATLGGELHLVLVVGDNLGKFLLDVGRLGGLTTNTSEGARSVIETPTLDVPPGRFGEKGDTATEDESPSELDGDGDTVRTGVETVLGGVHDTGGEEETDGNVELVARDDGTTDLAGSNLGHVENDDGRDESDTETGDKTSSNNQTQTRVGSDLENDTDGEDDAAGNDGQTTSKVVGQVTSDDGTEECTGGEDRDDERFVGGGKGEGILLGLRCVCAGDLETGVEVDEVGHSHDT